MTSATLAMQCLMEQFREEAKLSGFEEAIETFCDFIQREENLEEQTKDSLLEALRSILNRRKIEHEEIQ